MYIPVHTYVGCAYLRRVYPLALVCIPVYTGMHDYNPPIPLDSHIRNIRFTYP